MNRPAKNIAAWLTRDTNDCYCTHLDQRWWKKVKKPEIDNRGKNHKQQRPRRAKATSGKAPTHHRGKSTSSRMIVSFQVQRGLDADLQRSWLSHREIVFWAAGASGCMPRQTKIPSAVVKTCLARVQLPNRSHPPQLIQWSGSYLKRLATTNMILLVINKLKRRSPP